MTAPTNASRPTAWIKASASDANGHCVQMRRNGQHIQIRDSKQGENSPVLSFTGPEIRAWLEGASRGEFDGLIGVIS